MRPIKVFTLFFFLLVLCSPAWSDVIPDAKRAAERLDKLYGEAGPYVGSLLYDPCYVLVIGELRPEGSWNGMPLVAAHDGTLESLNRMGEAYGLDFSNRQGELVVRSLEGLSLISRECNFSGARPYQTATGWEGWNSWFKELRQGLDVPENVKSHYIVGVKLGYPDTAIKGYIGDDESYLRHSRAVGADIRNADFLENGQPEFDLLPEDVGAPDVERTCRRWSEFLGAFYALPEVRERLTDSEFLSARRKRKQDIHWSAQERWLRGEVQHPNQLERIVHGIRRGEELVLQNNIEELERLVVSGAPPYEWLRACLQWGLKEGRYTLVSPLTLWDWIWWGSYDLDPFRSRLYRATLQASPTLFEAILDEKIDSWERLAAREEGSGGAAAGTVVLWSNPEFKKRFSQMPLEQQRSYLELLEQWQDPQVIKLLEDPVYGAGEVQLP